MSTITGAAVLYHGPSMIDGEEIVMIATSGSKNAKTGEMIQTWILRADVEPNRAARDGRDVSICGNCPLRFDAATGRRDCYVRTQEAPLSVYRAWQRGRYAYATDAASRADFGADKLVRMGSYGDPAAVPAQVWAQLLSRSAGRTGYTHQWGTDDPTLAANARALRPYVMASADSASDHLAALKAGWRTFRTRRPTDAILPRERVCPASDEAGKRTTCAACRACSGTAGRGHSSIVINLHGAAAKRAA